MKKLLKKPLVQILIATGVAFICIGAYGFWMVNFSLGRLSVIDVTTTQMASAMREDHYWYTYRFNTLIFNGKVTNIYYVNGIKSAQLATDDSYTVTCQFPGGANITQGKTYRFLTEANQADRLPAGVLVHNCTII